jgi:hypothetical protein
MFTMLTGFAGGIIGIVAKRVSLVLINARISTIAIPVGGHEVHQQDWVDRRK